MDTPDPSYRAPFWLRCLILGVLLWLGVRIVGNVTEALTRMAGGAPPPTTLVRGD